MSFLYCNYTDWSKDTGMRMTLVSLTKTYCPDESMDSNQCNSMNKHTCFSNERFGIVLNAESSFSNRGVCMQLN